MNAQAFQTAAELIAFHGKTSAIDIATAQIKRYARNVVPESVSTLVFWGEVLQRVAGLELAAQEIHHLRSACSKARCSALMALLPAPVALASRAA